MDWLLSALTLIANYLIGRKIKWGWVVSFFGSALWSYYALFMLNPPQYGLVPAAAINMYISFEAGLRWFKES